MDKITLKSLFDGANTIIILASTIVSTVLAFLVYNDHSQLQVLADLNVKQGKQLEVVNQLLENNGSLLRNAQLQVNITQEQRTAALRFDTLKVKANIYMLVVFTNDLRKLKGLLRDVDSANYQVKLLSALKALQDRF